MSIDPIVERIVKDLIWIRRQSGDFAARISQRQSLIDVVGGGSVRRVRDELERIRRRFAKEPDSDVLAYFSSAGAGNRGAGLERRLDIYARRRHVVVRTALRRSDRGARVIATLLREGMRHERPWAYAIATQRETTLQVRVTLNVAVDSDLRPAAFHVNGQTVEVEPTYSHDDDLYRDVYRYKLPSMTLDTSAGVDDPLARVVVAWVPAVAPIWELVASLADDRLYAHLTVEPFPTVELEIRWWNDRAASARDWPLSRGRF